MAVNLSSAAFATETTANQFGQKCIAETYMQIYPYAAEDFVSHADFHRFIIELHNWMGQVDTKLSQQFELISNHSHPIPAHSHSNDGMQMVSLVTSAPTQKPMWNPSKYPMFFNLTNSLTNLGGNFAVTSTSSEGSAIPVMRRSLPLPLTLVPRLSPVLTDSLKEAAVGVVGA